MKCDRFSINQRLITFLTCSFNAVVILCSAASGQTTTDKPQEFSPGINVGKSIPTIELKNQADELVSVQSLLENGPVALVLFRSADW